MDEFQLFADSKKIFGSIDWPWIVAVLHVLLSATATVHALLYKRDPRAALGWISVSLFFPLFGPLLYYTFGINRVRTQALKFSGRKPLGFKIGYEGGIVQGARAQLSFSASVPWRHFVRISDRLCKFSLTTGNTVQLLRNGNQAYPVMREAIAGAKTTIFLASYIFQSDSIGREFATALSDAAKRGVQVWVMIDGVGEFYSWPRIRNILKRHGVQVTRFLPPRLIPPTFYVNLRNHRKILVVDGAIGFTGGMNIGKRHIVDESRQRGTADLHFCVQGPVVEQLSQVFADDWQFVTGETLPVSSASESKPGSVFARCISDGPNDDMDTISSVLMAAISAAQQSVTIVSPYFLPFAGLLASMQSAALRGVEVVIILPEKSNLRFVDWASRNMLWELLQYGVNVYYQPAPFSHTKLALIDGMYAQIGSANMDPRSLRLNFELNMELIGETNVTELVAFANSLRRRSRQLTLREVEERSIPARIRDAFFWLFTPYL